MWGRSLYKNIQRFLLFQLTVNVAACFLVLFGSFMGTESPPNCHTNAVGQSHHGYLWCDGTCFTSAFESVMNDRPRRREASILSSSMLWELCSVGFTFFVITLGFYWLFNHATVTSIPQMFHTVVGAAQEMTPYEATLLFSIFVWTHFWYMFNARSFDTGESVFKLKMSSGFGRLWQL